jgi:N-acetylgalactosamine-N,N'-diacetylbacillosaminyl-diphospho-undecaprenol 4-alpha-N-acetylgalactosaminyltransferase
MINKLSNESIKVKKEKFTFISVGRLDKGKNHLLLIEAMKSVNAVLWIIGTGNEMGYLKKYINSKKLNEKVLLLNNKKNPFSYLSKADCFVFSSKHEGFPNVIVEALACKLPVISSDCRFGPREILSPQSDFSFELEKEIELAEFGILYPVNSLKKLIDSMTLIINNVSLRKKYKNISSKRADHFNLNKVIIDFDKVISN